MTKVQNFVILFLLYWMLPCQGQDVHFSQYDMAPSLLSSALSTTFDAEFQGGMIVKNQWTQIVPYKSFLGYFNHRIQHAFLGNSIAIGGQFQYDKAGDGDLSLTKFDIQATISRPLSSNFTLSLGTQLGYGLRQFSPNQLQFESQFFDKYDPNTPSGETFSSTHLGYFDMGISLNGQFQVHQLASNIGMATHHLNQPKVGFLDKEIHLFPISNFYTINSFQLAPKINLLVDAFFRKQQVYQELVFNGGIQLFIHKETNKNIALSIRNGWRLGDAIMPTLQFQYHNWQIGWSYDTNTSAFQITTLGKGGPELALKYTSNALVSPKIIKPCPIL